MAGGSGAERLAFVRGLVAVVAAVRVAEMRGRPEPAIEGDGADRLGRFAQQVPGVLDVAVKSALLATVVKVKQQYDGHARHALLAAMGAHLDYNKMVIAVDEDVDIHDYEDIFWAYLTRGRADTRAWIINDVPGFYRDPLKDHWGRLLIDATKPRGREEEFERKRIPGEMEVRLEDYLGKGA